jgi:vacuolar-type H+-ATPase subunit F/Vma7
MSDDVASGKPSHTRLIAIGSAALVEGFGLIGFETYPNATLDGLEEILEEIAGTPQPAMIFLESALARCPCGILEQIRTQYARIVVVEIPTLNAPADFHPEVEGLVTSVLGSGALETQT